MTVWIVREFWHNDPQDRSFAIFSTLEKAEKFLRTLDTNSGWDNDIEEYTLDKREE